MFYISRDYILLIELYLFRIIQDEDCTWLSSCQNNIFFKKNKKVNFQTIKVIMELNIFQNLELRITLI